MKCPCNNGDIEPRDFRSYLAQNREAQMMAAAVLKSQPFGGTPMQRAERDGRPVLVIGEQQDRETAERELRRPLWRRLLGR